MSVRRLHPEQPESFAFTPENLAWAQMVIARYPEGRQQSAIIPLLWRAQEQEGWITEPCIRHLADMLGMAKIRVLEVATFYTMFQLAPVGKKAHVQVCGTTPCMLRGSEELISICRSRIHHEPFHLSADGDFSWEEVECLGACVNAPMVQVFKDTYEDLTAESFNALLDGFAKGEPPRPGPQIDRQFSAPEGGPTALTDLDAILKHPPGAERSAQPVGGELESVGQPADKAPRPEQRAEDSPAKRVEAGEKPLKSGDLAAAAPADPALGPKAPAASGKSEG